MATSGVTTTELNRDSIISSALRKLGWAKGQTPDATDLADATEALNNLVAEFMTMGMPLWSLTSYDLPLVDGTSSYTLTNPFPLKVVQAYISLSATSKQDVNPTPTYDFNILPAGASGIPSQFTYLPNINYGTFRVWPEPDATAAAGTFTIWYYAPFDTFVSATNTPYFPREWNNALVYGLAALLAPEYGVPLNDRGELEKKADKHLQIALDFGAENASLYFQPHNN
jgi:hypothetical protein